eukprot:141924-Chlamydomonas_euryale.AAC.3
MTSDSDKRIFFIGCSLSRCNTWRGKAFAWPCCHLHLHALPSLQSAPGALTIRNDRMAFAWPSRLASASQSLPCWGTVQTRLPACQHRGDAASDAYSAHPAVPLTQRSLRQCLRVVFGCAAAHHEHSTSAVSAPRADTARPNKAPRTSACSLGAAQPAGRRR